MILKIDHIGIAVKALESRLPFWADALSMEVEGIETVETEKVKVAFLAAGPSKVELLEPTGPDSTVARFLETRGEGIHHVTLEVADLAAVVEHLRVRGIETLGGVRPGAGGRQVVFIHPRSAGGVLVELVSARQTPARRKQLLEAGAAVLAYLREPQEKIWGVLRRLDGTGVVIEGIDLGSFDDWLTQIERGDESVVGPSVLFIPMARLEKVLLDRSSGDLPSLAERFARRIGRSVQDVLDGDGEGAED